MAFGLLCAFLVLAAALAGARLTRRVRPLWYAVGLIFTGWSLFAPDSLPAGELRSPSSLLLGLTLSLLSALHVYWAFGGRGGFAVAIPEIQGSPAFRPPPWMTLVVAVMLAFAASLSFYVGLIASHPPPSQPVHVATFVMGGVFLLRAFGDFRYVGVFKSIRDTGFARWDDLLFNPLCWWIGTLACWSAR
ncbi:MAG: DUF3995 domain-containing protein [Myxococcota bacterium]